MQTFHFSHNLVRESIGDLRIRDVRQASYPEQLGSAERAAIVVLASIVLIGAADVYAVEHAILADGGREVAVANRVGGFVCLSAQDCVSFR